MKKYILLLAAMLMCLPFTSCSSDDPESGGGSNSQLKATLQQYAWASDVSYDFLIWGDLNFSFQKEKNTLFFTEDNSGICETFVHDDDTYLGSSNEKFPSSFKYSISGSNVIISGQTYTLSNDMLIATDGSSYFKRKNITSSDRTWLESAKYYVMPDDKRQDIIYWEGCLCLSDYVADGKRYAPVIFSLGVDETEHAYDRGITSITATYTISGGKWSTTSVSTQSLTLSISKTGNSSTQKSLTAIMSPKAKATITATFKMRDSKTKKDITIGTATYKVPKDADDKDDQGNQDVPTERCILYTSTDGKVVKPNKTDAFGVSIVSNTYENGQGRITFDGNVTKIEDKAFYGCSSLTSVTIPNSVTTIGNYAFSGCTGLTKVTLPKSLTTLGGSTFAHCSSLTSVTIPNSVKTIGYFAFYECSSLTSVTIPNSVTSIGEEAFAHCSSLTSVTIPNSVTWIGSKAFRYCTSLKSVNIPNSVTEIEWYAFDGCTGLTSVTIPNSVKTIGWYAFSYCSGLTSITIPNSVTSIKNEAFYGCSGLTAITIGNSVTSIGGSAFGSCTSLNEIKSLNTKPFRIEANTFDRVPSACVLKVPASATDAYKKAIYWQNFKNIVGI